MRRAVKIQPQGPPVRGAGYEPGYTQSQESFQERVSDRWAYDNGS